MSGDLFGGDLAWPRVRVLMALDPDYYELMWTGLKTHEFRRRFLQGVAVQWFTYLTKQTGALGAIIDLEPAVVDAPTRIAAIAERVRSGNGASVYEYLHDLAVGYAMPITRVRQLTPFTAADLTRMLDGFHPPQGYTFIDKNPQLAAVCDRFAAGAVLRELTITHP